MTVNLSGQPSQTIGYTYDAFNNRASQSANGINTYYLVDPSSTQLLGEFPSGPSAPQPTYYISGLGQQSNGVLSYFTTDGLGSVRQLTDANGALSYAANFDPYGNLLETNQISGSTNLGYTGAPSDPSGLIYLNARFYNPSIGAFQTHDPLEGVPTNPESFNGYSYAQSNPFSNVDPTGKECESSNTFQSCVDRIKTVASKLFDIAWSQPWHKTWDGGLTSYVATQQEGLKNAGEWWSAGGSTQFIGIFFPEAFAVNTIQEWAKGRQPQWSDVLSFLPVVGYAGRVFESLGSLGQLGDGTSAVASDAESLGGGDVAAIGDGIGGSLEEGASNAIGGGPGLRYKSEIPTSDMVKQIAEKACGLACVSQILKDEGVTASQQEIGQIVAYNPLKGGANFDTLPNALNELGQGGYKFKYLIIPGAIGDLTARGPWIASLGVPVLKAWHAVIVDAIEGDTVNQVEYFGQSFAVRGDSVIIRDPAGITGSNTNMGSRGVMDMKTFLNYWFAGQFSAVYKW